jgi:hypothetical protein
MERVRITEKSAGLKDEPGRPFLAAPSIHDRDREA